MTCWRLGWRLVIFRTWVWIACLERSFITLADAQLLVACLAQLERADAESSVAFAGALRRLRLERAARRLSA